MNTKLLCLFSTINNVDTSVAGILSDFYGIEKLFIFKNSERESDLYITFNIDLDTNSNFSNYIVIHRKKESNTLYTVNALNIIIKNLNNGVLDKTFKLDWKNYRNTFLLSRANEVERIPLTLYKIKYY